MKKAILSIAAATIIAASSLTGCSAPESAQNEKFNIICTVYPIYDWVTEIVGDQENINVSYLLNNGADLHNYQPGADDMIRISGCDMFIYVGGESDEWVNAALDEAVNDDMTVISLLDCINDSNKLLEEEKEGMEPSDEEEEDEAYDEHIWLSLNAAEQCCSEINNKLSSRLPDKSAAFNSGCENYISKLDALDKSYRDTLSAKTENTLIFADRFPFLYLVNDYGLDYYAAFSGCSAETEASFNTIAFLAKKVDELNVSTIFTIEGSDSSIAEAVIDNTTSKSQNIAVLNSAQSISDDDIKNGMTYLSIMENNLEVLKEALK